MQKKLVFVALGYGVAPKAATGRNERKRVKEAAGAKAERRNSRPA